MIIGQIHNHMYFHIWNKMTYCPRVWIVCHFIPCCNKDPVGIEVQPWEVPINVSCGLLENTAAGVLVVEDLTISSVV